MEIIKLNLIPSGVNPTCHCSQYDDGRVIRIELFDGLTPYILQSGDTVTLNVRKPDNTIVTASVTATQGNKYVDIVTTEQICACVGYNLCDLTITNGSVVIGTLNFIMAIERDVLADGIPSQSVIEDLDARIQEALGDDYYNKTETDALLALKADKSEIYNTYPTDTASGPIASFTDGADNIPVKSLIAQIVAQQAGSGDPSPSNPRAISGFSSGVVSVCGKNLVSNSDFTYGLPNTTIGADINAIIPTTRYAYFGFIPPKTTCIFSVKTSDRDRYSILLCFGYKNNKLTSYSNVPAYTDQVRSQVFDLSEFDYFRICIGAGSGYDTFEDLTGNGYVQLEVGETATTFEAYNGTTYTFAFGQTVYGGHFDNKGNLVVTHKDFTYDGNENWVNVGGQYPFAFYLDTLLTDMRTDNANGNLSNIFPWTIEPVPISNAMRWQNPTNTGRLYVYDYDHSGDLASFKAMLNTTPLKATYLLANPITLAITSQDIPTLLGNNNIFADTGDVEVNYRADIGLYIDKKISQIPTALNSTRGSEELRTISAPVITDEIRDEEPIETPTNDEER